MMGSDEAGLALAQSISDVTRLAAAAVTCLDTSGKSWALSTILESARQASVKNGAPALVGLIKVTSCWSQVGPT